MKSPEEDEGAQKVGPLRVPINIGLRQADAQPPELPAAGLTLAVEAIRLAVASYARQLAEDLVLAAELPITIEVADEALPQELPFSLTVGGKAARLDLRRGREAVAVAIPREIYRNRALLITSGVARNFAVSIWPNANLTAADVTKLTKIMRCCVERNVDMGRLREALMAREVADLENCWELVFATHSEEALRIQVNVHLDVYRELGKADGFGEPLLVDFQRKVFEELALLCPLPLLKSAVELSRNEWQCRINDVRLPVRRLDEQAKVGPQILASLHADLLREPEFLFTREGVERGLTFLCKTYPALVENVRSRIGVNVVCQVLQGLVREGLSVSIGRVLDMLTFARGTHQVKSRYITFTSDAETAVWNAHEQTKLSAEHYLRAVRTKLNREITYRYADHPTPGVAPSLPVYLLDPEIERRVNAMDKKPLTNAERLQLVRALLSDVGTGQAVVLTTEDVRGAFWSLVHPELPDLTVLAYQDLSPHCTIKPLARITLNHQA